MCVCVWIYYRFFTKLKTMCCLSPCNFIFRATVANAAGLYPLVSELVDLDSSSELIKNRTIEDVFGDYDVGNRSLYDVNLQMAHRKEDMIAR